MIFQVTSIEFDFESDGEIAPQDYQDNIIIETKAKLWEVEDEDELVDSISDCFGWCIKSIEYNQVIS